MRYYAFAVPSLNLLNVFQQEGKGVSVGRCAKLLEKAKSSPKNLKFDDLCALAECYGWAFQRQCGSHRIYLHAQLGNVTGSMMNFQSRKGKAKPSQVRQLLDAIEELMHDQ